MVGFSTGSVERGLEILELLVNHPEGVSLTSICERLELPKSAAHKLLGTLLNRHFVARDSITQHYKPTMRIVTLGVRLLEATRLPEICQPILDDLARKTEELVRMTVVDGESLAWVAKAQGARETLRVDPIMARPVPLHATATGKVWLASLPEVDALRIVLRNGFDSLPVGPKALTSVDQLRHELRKTRTRGYGLAIEEAEPGVCAIAAGIRYGTAEDATVVGTVSVAGPKVRMSPKRMSDLAPVLLATARSLSTLWPARQRHVSMHIT